MQAHRVVALVSAVLMMACSTGNSSPSGGSAGPIVIGEAIALSGNLNVVDVPTANGLKLAAEQINAKGGIGGRQIRIVQSDTKSEAANSSIAAQDVLSQGASFVLATCDYGLGSPAVRAANAKGILGIGCGGSPLYGRQGIGPLAFDPYPGSATEGAINAEFAYNTKGWRHPYILTDVTEEYSKVVGQYFEIRWDQLAGTGTIVGKDTFLNADPSIAAQVSRIREMASRVDFLVLSTYPPGVAPAVRQIRAAGITLPIVAAAANDGSYWLPAVPDLSNFYYPSLGSIFGDDPSPIRTKFFGDYTTLTGQPPFSATYPLLGYAIMQMLEIAIGKAGGSTSGSDVAKALEGFNNVDLITGPTTFTAQCHMPVGQPFLMIQIQNGKNSFTGTIIKPKVPPVPC